MEKVDFSVEDVRKLTELVEKYCLAELTVEENGLCITIKGRGAADSGSGTGSSQTLAHTVLPNSLPQSVGAAPLMSSLRPTKESSAFPRLPDSKQAENLSRILAPMVGVFYRAPAPDQPSYVEVGDKIEIGQTIGLIEAMKVFSEIPSEIAGEVVEIPAQNCKLVQQDDTLIVVRVSEE